MGLGLSAETRAQKIKNDRVKILQTTVEEHRKRERQKTFVPKVHNKIQLYYYHH